MKINILLIIALAFITIFSSCKKEEEQSSVPVITLTTPHSEEEFNAGDTIYVKGTITDNEELHELLVLIYEQGSGDTLMNYTPTVHGLQSFAIDTFYAPSTTDHVHYHLKIVAWDHDNNADSLNYTLHWAD